MDQEDYKTDPFSGHGLWRISQFTLQSLQPLEPLPWDEKLPDLSGGVFKSPLNIIDKTASELPDLNAFGTDLFDADRTLGLVTNASNESQTNAAPSAHGAEEEETEDIFALADLEVKPDRETLLKTWEKFYDRTSHEPVSAYFSESGAKAFDAELAQRDATQGTQDKKRIAPQDLFFQALLKLGLGWSSVFFRYNEDARQFERVRDDIRISGVTSVALNGLTKELLQCGTCMQRIRGFVGKVSVKSYEFSALSAFTSAAAVIVYTLEKQLVGSFKHIASLLQIKALFQECGKIMSVLANIVEAVDGAASEAQIISVVLERAAHFSQLFDHMGALLHELVNRVAVPWLTHVETWVGLRPETMASIEMASSGKSFVAMETHEENRKIFSKTPRVDYRYLPDQMPSFVPPDQASLIFESGRSLRLLKRNHPQHPIANRGNSDAGMNFECASTWFDIERIQRKASDYEARVRSEILRYNRGEAHTGLSEVLPAEVSGHAENHDILAGTFELFDLDVAHKATELLPHDGASTEDKIGYLLDGSTKVDDLGLSTAPSDFGPELTSSIYLSLAPLLSSQALLIDFSCLHLLFKEHRLRYHLTLQWRFQLLGDGFFTTRISNSLFDPHMESGERKVGVVRSDVHAGLRLGSRDTWPPASSELRLVLIGLLNECHDADKQSDSMDHADRNKERELPGGLSFSIRDLTDEEIAKCKDPNAIEALDFLRLQYKPSTVLEAILTHRSLNKYDRLFKHLLRLLRMVSVVKTLIRDSTARDSMSGDTRNVLQKFRIDCQHFVLAISDYCFHVGVGSTWQRFQDTLSRIESCLDKGDIDGTIEAAHSVPRLRDYHEDILDQILYALFLSKKHNEVAILLENIFGTILTFAPLSRLDGVSGVRHQSETTVRRLYSLFRKQTSAFVGYLRGIEGGKTPSRSFGKLGMAYTSREAPTSVFDHLLARLEMKTYY
ncbi:gamma-tubulin complex component GCP6 [Aspergillus heteromorphus CBS 117.55]|uniref:Spindle pole body component n=1 Tax=Aspergillus heteromorphus CBS 117.55 TaxID=1448321 RepID=A0A317VZZ1_9EURO|nr:gamma-tubulin complex component GCP6 [Aspergillus heteromorphus CBS 117.55]PWY77460.1 gamma-tubulin complex component GCP6 [Aspergillus heteromorphus CBS 117.55]